MVLSCVFALSSTKSPNLQLWYHFLVPLPSSSIISMICHNLQPSLGAAYLSSQVGLLSWVTHHRQKYWDVAACKFLYQTLLNAEVVHCRDAVIFTNFAQLPILQLCLILSPLNSASSSLGTKAVICERWCSQYTASFLGLLAGTFPVRSLLFRN